MTNEAVLEADVKKQWIIAQYPRSQLMVSDKSLRLVIELPAELSRAVFNRIGHGSIIGDSGYVAVMPANAELYQEFLNSINGVAHPRAQNGDISGENDSKPQENKDKTVCASHQHGDYARKLYTSGFFLHQEVLEALGTDEEFRAWIQQQPSCISGKQDYIGMESGEMRCEASHVERVHAGHGKGIKAPYCCVPLTHEEHQLRHQKGETHVYWVLHRKEALESFERDGLTYPPSVIGIPPEKLESTAKEWFWDQRCKKVTEWAKMRLKQELNVESLADASPSMIAMWAQMQNLANFLPTPRE